MRARSWAVSALLLTGAAFGAEPLPGYGAELSAFTVSGVSSGGYMAVQVQVAHSSRVTGVGALAAGPYFCARGSLWIAWTECMTGTPRVSPAEATRFAAEGLVDPVANLARTRVWLFSGRRDRTVAPRVVRALKAFYEAHGARPVLVDDKSAGHGMITVGAGNACGASEPPFINDCDYDAAGELLGHLLGPLSPPSAEPGGQVVAFDQREFGGGAEVSMGETGFAYVPASCLRERCRVHVAFHGCRQGAGAVGERFVREAGYNRWADTNRLIVLYPQAVARYAWWTFNPRGCWDWWGYTGSEYATKEASQIRAVIGMVERLAMPAKEKR